MEKTIKIELTLQEAQHLNELLDIAVKAGGLNVAAAALPIATKVKDAAKVTAETE